ncbi:hypothetical protein Q3304_13925 [Clostridioides sp. GD02377]|uniref:hypothetical protein n=1 Tax=Clostridioides sp. GD02377 TaxID=3054353 RepID=UPI0038A79333
MEVNLYKINNKYIDSAYISRFIYNVLGKFTRNYMQKNMILITSGMLHSIPLFVGLESSAYCMFKSTLF